MCGDPPHSLQLHVETVTWVEHAGRRFRCSVSTRGQLGAVSLSGTRASLSHDGVCCGRREEEKQSESGRGETVDAADFNWSACGETRGAELLKVGES